MKKKHIRMMMLCFSLPLAGSGAEPWQQAKIKVYVIRHGQRITPVDYSCDPSLTPTGIRQAELTAAELKRKGFKGRIYSSPYRRTLETASIIAGKLDCPVYLCADIQEYWPHRETPPLPQRNANDLRKEFPRIAADSTLDSPWGIRGPENLQSVRKRVLNLVNRLLPAEKGPDVLFVTHGAVLKGFQLMMINHDSSVLPQMPMNWNCALSIYSLDGTNPPVTERLFDVSFLPEQLITSNEKSKSRTE